MAAISTPAPPKPAAPEVEDSKDTAALSQPETEVAIEPTEAGATKAKM